KIKPKNLLPFFLAHAAADIIGLNVLSYILY
ncbi:CPBP family intramembrane glutamate endopeptidase, partial [Streptococcus suis]